jgi:protein-tyrosine phosphatase
MLFDLVEAMKQFLLADSENVVVIHCNSGKGRAGTALVCLLVYLGFYDSVYEAA